MYNITIVSFNSVFFNLTAKFGLNYSFNCKILNLIPNNQYELKVSWKSTSPCIIIFNFKNYKFITDEKIVFISKDFLLNGIITVFPIGKSFNKNSYNIPLYFQLHKQYLNIPFLAFKLFFYLIPFLILIFFIIKLF